MNERKTPQLRFPLQQQNEFFNDICERLVAANAYVLTINEYDYYIHYSGVLWSLADYTEMATLLRQFGHPEFTRSVGLHQMGGSFHCSVKHNPMFLHSGIVCPKEYPNYCRDWRYVWHRKWWNKMQNPTTAKKTTKQRKTNNDYN